MTDPSLPWWAQSSMSSESDLSNEEVVEDSDPWSDLADLDEEDLIATLDWRESEVEEGGQNIPAPDYGHNGSEPVLIVHRPHGNSAWIPPLLRALKRAEGNDVALGSVASLTRLNPADRSRYLDSCDAAVVRIADPMAFVFFDQVPGRRSLSARSQRWEFQQHIPGASQSEVAGWVNSVVEAQRIAGANMFLTPGRWMPSVDPSAELDMAFSHADYVAQVLNSDENMAVNFTLARDWLAQESLRDKLLQWVVESEYSTFYVRVLWSMLGTTHGHPLDLELLEGYRELCQTAQEEGVRIFLPESDLTGWMTLAWGSAGFGTGVSSGDRAFSQQRPSGPAATPKPRYLETQLLHTILQTEHQQLKMLPEHVDCSCVYCSKSNSGTPWKSIQAQHHVSVLAKLAANVYRASKASINPASHVLSVIQDAINFADISAKRVIYSSESRPVHLPIWLKSLM
ncbi:hypothetical protein [Saccharothrix variisporea]|uniref:Uncharacterized protein n=1 Tax=Saccharothrix variisporea TaxID=543527 RepID=A0A495XF32_9PSEU|nr:hypothetical protein [Saccharothrix variisporea]RKT72632.1 hypothetical protein DFJ66_5951 [Saccharothrix variisporea]